ERCRAGSPGVRSHRPSASTWRYRVPEHGRVAWRSVGPVDQGTPCLGEGGGDLVGVAHRSNGHRPGAEHDQLLGDDAWTSRTELTQQAGHLAQQPYAVFVSD